MLCHVQSVNYKERIDIYTKSPQSWFEIKLNIQKTFYPDSFAVNNLKKRTVPLSLFVFSFLCFEYQTHL